VRAQPDLPTGTVTLLFCDIEGSTALARRLGDAWPAALADHRAVLRRAVDDHGGLELGTEGDGLLAAFPRAGDAIAAAVDAQRALAAHPWPDDAAIRVRMGLHTGEPTLTPEGYEGLDMHRGARVMAAGHGGQVLLTSAVRETAGDRLPPGVTVRDLGRHALRDFPRRDSLYQLVIDGLPAGFPPLRAGGGAPSKLPRAPTRLIGREREVAEVTALLSDDGARLVTLTGPGGVGKTRLALDLALALEPAHFLALASVADPALVATTLVQSLGVVDGGEEPAAEVLAGALAGEDLLLVLDNLEHLLPAASLVSDLLASCPRLRVLATSREPLRIRGEQIVPVAPLRQAPAAALFVDRARAQDGAFELGDANAVGVAEICARLDGLPLAIELAAARIGLLTAQELATRLGTALDALGPGSRDAPERHQTLRATMDWSFRLLEEPERRAFSALAAFRGGCTLEAAETVAPAPLTVLQSLLAKSLLVRSEGRLTMLETVREYALERLDQRADRDDVHRRHGGHFLTMAEQHRRGLALGDHEAIAALDAEVDNLRAALGWAAEHDRALMSELSAALGQYWLASHGYDDGRRWVQAALDVAVGEVTPAVRAELLLTRPRLFSRKGSGDTRDAHEALAHFERLGDAAGESRCLGFLSTEETFSANWPAADALADRALESARRAGDDLLIGLALHAKSMAQPHLGPAAAIAEEAATYLRRAGAISHVGVLLSTTGFIAITDEAYERADELLGAALEAATAARDIHRVAAVRGNQGLVALFQQHTDVAARAFRDELTLCRGSRFSQGSLAWEGLLGLAAVAAADGDPRGAARLAGAARACNEFALNRAESPVYDRLTGRFLGPARAALGPAIWDRIHDAGRREPSEALIDATLGELSLIERTAAPQSRRAR
jgi:predicted ATPase/class 3 adenylate cyclase